MSDYYSVKANGAYLETSLPPVAGNVLVDSGMSFPSGSQVTSVFKSVAPGTIPGVGADKGNAVLVGGTKAVADTAVTASSVILLTRKTIGGTVGNISYTTSTGVGFTINSDSALDTSTVSYVRFG